MTSYTNGVGVTFTQSFDSAGRVSGLTSSLVDSQHPATLFTTDSSVGYYPHGANLAFEKTTTIAYDDRGEKAEERTNFTGNSVIPVGVPHRRNEEGHLVPSNPTAEPPASPHLPDHSSIIRYAYQYDTYGNWTQQIASYSSQPDQPSTARNRKLTYY